MKKAIIPWALALLATQAHAGMVCIQGSSGVWIPNPATAPHPTPSEIQTCADLGAPMEAAKKAQEKAAAAAAKAAAVPTWVLGKGESVSQGLQSWAKKSSWTVVWDTPNDWAVPNGVQFTGDFQSAATQVIESLSKNGADIRADVYPANKTFVVHQAGGSN